MNYFEPARCLLTHSLCRSFRPSVCFCCCATLLLLCQLCRNLLTLSSAAAAAAGRGSNGSSALCQAQRFYNCGIFRCFSLLLLFDFNFGFGFVSSLWLIALAFCQQRRLWKSAAAALLPLLLRLLKSNANESRAHMQ